MEKITNLNELNNTILLLETKLVESKISLRNQIKLTYESLKPVNFIRNTLIELITAPGFNQNILNTMVSIGAGYISKKISIGKSHNPIKQIFGEFLQIGITSAVFKNSETIKSKIGQTLSAVFRKRNNS